MSVRIIDLLEVVDIYHGQSKGALVALRADCLAFEGLQKVALVGDAGQAVGDRHGIDRFVILTFNAVSDQELENALADTEKVAGRQYLLLNTMVIEVRTVEALQISYAVELFGFIKLNPSVLARHRPVAESQVTV